MTKIFFKILLTFSRIWLSLISYVLFSFNYLLKPQIKVECFVIGFPFAVAGLQNFVSWKVSGAHRVTINGIPVNPFKGEFVFISDFNQKFILICYNGREKLEREISVATYSYKQKQDISYNRYAPIPILLSERIKQVSFKPIPQDLNLTTLNTKLTQKGIQKTLASMGDEQLDRLCSQKVFESIHDDFIESRLSYDKRYATALSEIFKNNVVPADYMKQITSFIKTNYLSKT